MKTLLPLDNSNGQIDLEGKQPKKFKTFVHHPEKENCRIRVVSPHQNKTYTVIPQTFTTNKEKVESTKQRPRMGGKTIAAIHHLPAGTVMTKPARMSSQELKLLSRRIDPHEPLSSPHASPTKPPLPNLKRLRAQLLEKKEHVDASDDNDNLPIKRTQQQQYKCQPCNKIYKTKNGYSYHQVKCQHRHPKRIFETVINCVCQFDKQDDSETMIECVQCHTWLHLKCAGSVTKEESYCCPRCLPPKKGETASINAMVQIKQESPEKDPYDDDDNQTFTSLFAEDLMLPPSTIVADDMFNTNDWSNSDDLPSLLFSSDNLPSNSSFVDEFPSSPPSMDWFHFANFEQDFTFE